MGLRLENKVAIITGLVQDLDSKLQNSLLRKELKF